MKIQIVAEMACSHEGDASLAKKIIEASVEARADAVQFQIWKLDAMVTPKHRDRELLSRLELSQETWTGLFEHAARGGLDVVVCVSEEASVAFAETLRIAAWKIHCSDIANPRLLRRVAATGRPVHLSIGASTAAEIETALSILTAAGSREVRLLHGYQSFPTPVDDVHLHAMVAAGKRFLRPYGYQDHSDPELPAAFALSATAIGLGATVIEKHVTHDRSKRGVDHESALNPAELVRFVRMIREIEGALGDAGPRPFSEAQERYRRGCRKTTVAARALDEGHRLRDEDFLYLRAETPGLSPQEAQRLVGKSLRRAIGAYEALAESDLG